MGAAVFLLYKQLQKEIHHFYPLSAASFKFLELIHTLLVNNFINVYIIVEVPGIIPPWSALLHPYRYNSRFTG
jgi:hypothetical protein